jgi:Fe-S-cluster containining protein
VLTERTCPGDCCFGFTLSVTRERLREIAGTDLRRSDATDATKSVVRNARMIEAMVIPLGPHPVNGEPSFTCRYWAGPPTKLCTVYERRPMMCRTYPDDGKCEFGCAFTGASSRVDAQ